MAKYTLNYTNGDDDVYIGNPVFDDGDDYTLNTLDGNDDFSLYVDGVLDVRAGKGDDYVLLGGSGTGSIYGDEGNDKIVHEANKLYDGVYSMYGGIGNDKIVGLAGEADKLYGEAGNDELYVYQDNVGAGGIGDDSYYLYEGGKISENVGEGIDTVYSKLSAFDFNGVKNIEKFVAVKNGALPIDVKVTGDANANIVQTINGNDTIRLGAGNDIALGGAGRDLLYGGDGDDELYGSSDDPYDADAVVNDKLYGEAGNDKLLGSYGTDYLSGGAGDDTLNGSRGADTLVGGSGNDTYLAKDITFDDTIVEAVGGGIDTLITDFSIGALAANVENVTITDRFWEASEATGNAMYNTIIGSKAVNLLKGMDGNDTISAKGGDDLVYGGNGDDTVKGDAGNDRVDGDAGSDTMNGGAGDDMMRGGLDNDTLIGGDGYDVLSGDYGNDNLYGGGLNDTLNGNFRDDRQVGGAGGDLLYGGPGSDTFVFLSTTDSVIGDFFSGRGGDHIDLSAIDANTALAGNQAFTWGGMAYPEVAKAGNLWGQHFDASTSSPQFVRVYGDNNGDGTADFCIDVLNVVSLSVGDFFL